MFDECAPGFDQEISSVLSGVSHAGMGLSARLPHPPPTDDQPAKTRGRYGYNDLTFALLAINMAMAMFRGYLDHFFTFVPTGKVSEKATIQRSGLTQPQTMYRRCHDG
jgi:hypothetical protein